jgi:hypothetical protein
MYHEASLTRPRCQVSYEKAHPHTCDAAKCRDLRTITRLAIETLRPDSLKSLAKNGCSDAMQEMLMKCQEMKGAVEKLETERNVVG